MPFLSCFFGIFIRMFYDDHNPPHFHAVYRDYEALYALDGEKLSGTMPHKKEKQIQKWVALHQTELAENWRRAEAKQQFEKIEPLHKKEKR